MNQHQFRNLFTPGRIGTIQLKNRIVMPPMGTIYAKEGGYVSQRTIDHYEARARGGAGLIILEVTAPSLQCMSSPLQLTLGDDNRIPGFRELVEAVHKHGAKVAVQLHHGGWESRNGEQVQVAPSAVAVPTRVIGVNGRLPHELTIEEIQEIVQWFAKAAGRAKEAGFDGVEIHGAHQYLVASFLSSATNRREDIYGGSVENKARFLIEIIEACKQRAGNDFPVWPRLNSKEFGVENGTTLEETKQVVKMVTEAGADAIHASAYGAGSYASKAPIVDTRGFLVPLAAELKEVTSVPIIVTGRMDPEIGEQVLTEGKADFISMGRRLLADPELPNKVYEDKIKDIIRPCINCMDCIERMDASGMACTVNPVTGREREFEITQAANSKKVVVIGSGPAGVSAALVAKSRGHDVILYEKDSQPCGQLNVASRPPYKEDIIPLINYFAHQLETSGIDVRLNTEATADIVMESRPDAVILATGSVPVIPDIPGIDNQNIVTADDVLATRCSPGQNVVIIGGGMVGCETGHFLAKQGKTVTIVEMLHRIAGDMAPMLRRRIFDSLRNRSVSLMTDTTCKEIQNGSVIIETKDGKQQDIPFDTLILAAGYKSHNELYSSLKNTVPELYCIGDASQPRRIREAIYEGYRTGINI